MPSSKIVVIERFAAGGKEYAIGDSVSVRDTKEWGEGALTRRFQNGFVAYGEDADEVPSEAPAAPATPSAQKPQK